MFYLNFKKEELVNLDYSLSREILATNRAGGYLSTTLICSNTRKYHGLFIMPIQRFNNDRHVLLSSLDETVVQQGEAFNLGMHQYPNNVYDPQGYKYCRDVSYSPIFTLTYRVGGVILTKEIILVHDDSQLLIRYTLVEAHSSTKLRLKPFLAFRNVNALSKENMDANTYYNNIDNGISSRLYDGFPDLCMQTNKKCEFIATPDWYRNVEYSEEQQRGYDYREDLFVPGYFEFPIRKGESVIFSVSLANVPTHRLKVKFDKIASERKVRANFEDCLKYSANQFILRRGREVEVIAGFPWFGPWGRDTFIALPGVTLSANNDALTCKQALLTLCSRLKGGLFPNVGSGHDAAYNSIDAPMWFFKALQEYGKAVGDEEVWSVFSTYMKSILTAYRKGINSFSYMAENGLIWSREDGKALTWMDIVYNGMIPTQRGGFAVEINALWYNAVCYTLRLAQESGDNDFIQEWEGVADLIHNSFNTTFWNEELGYLADYVDELGQNLDIRPNQVFACSLEYTPLDEEKRASVMNCVTRTLLTPKGLRTLSPDNPQYQGVYFGTQEQRDRAYHQGTVWPWLLGAYIEANFRLYGDSFCNKAREIISNFEEDMTNSCVSSISEVYGGNPPHPAGGAVSQAWSIGEILRAMKLIEEYSK